MGCFYSDAEKNRTILEQIIQTVHSHTLAVEMSARLLESGIMEPLLLLKKLKEEKVALDATDTIGISKEAKVARRPIMTTFTRCSLCISFQKQKQILWETLRWLSFSGVQNRLFANWLSCVIWILSMIWLKKASSRQWKGRMIAFIQWCKEVTNRKKQNLLCRLVTPYWKAYSRFVCVMEKKFLIINSCSRPLNLW